MSTKSKPFPEEKFGPNLLKLCRDHRKTKCGRWGPELEGLRLKGRGLNWIIVSSNWSSFTARDTETAAYAPGFEGRFSWYGKFMDAETDFDWS